LQYIVQEENAQISIFPSKTNLKGPAGRHRFTDRPIQRLPHGIVQRLLPPRSLQTGFHLPVADR
jgi:hypothetical protein